MAWEARSSHLRKQVAVERFVTANGLLLAEVLGTCATGCTRRWVARELEALEQRGGQRVGVVALERPPHLGAVDDLRERATGATDDRSAGGQALDQHQPERLAERRQDDRPCL